MTVVRLEEKGILVECGKCGLKLLNIDKKGRLRRFMRGHNSTARLLKL